MAVTCFSLSGRTLFILGMSLALVGVSTAWGQNADNDLSLLAEEDLVALTPEGALDQAEAILRALEERKQEGDAEQDKELVDEVIRLTAFALNEQPLNKKAEYLQGRLALLSGRPREAMARIEEYIGGGERPGPGMTDWYAHVLLGELRLVSYPQLARPEFQVASELAPDEPKPFLGLARTELKLSQAKKAADYAQRGIQLDKERDPQYRVVLTEALLLDQELVQANQISREAIALGEERVRAKPGDLNLLRLLRTYYALHERCLAQLLEVYQENADYALQYVRVWQDRADLERLIEYHGALRAIEGLNEYEAFKATAEFRLEEARLNRIVGRDEAAIVILEQILNTWPDNAPAREMLQTLRPAPKDDPSAAPPTEPSPAAAAP